MKYSLLLLDIDGTLVVSGGDSLPSRRLVSAVKRAQLHTKVSLVTGRPVFQAQPVLDELGIEGLSIFEGGAEIVDVRSEEKVHTQYLSVAQMRQLYEIAASFDIPISYSANGYSSLLNHPDDINQTAALFFIPAVPTARVPMLIKALSVVENAVVHSATSWRKGDVLDLHITRADATKGSATEKLLSLTGYDPAEVMAIGDWHNDMPMLKVAGFAVAMGNAPKELKAMADYVAPSLEEDGAAEAIEKFIL